MTNILRACFIFDFAGIGRMAKRVSLLGFKPIIVRNLMLRSILLVSFFASFNAAANTVEHVNVGRIVVSDQSLKTQQAAGRDALAQVFIKLSGSQDVLKDSAISKAVDNFEQFLVSSSFLQKQDDLLFEATFNQEKIESLLLASGLNVWTNLRPSAILWVASENSTQAQSQSQNGTLLTQMQSSQMAKLIDQTAYARGVDIVVPVGDLEDNMQVSFFDVWNQYITKLQTASVRYATNYLISATIDEFNLEKYQQKQARLLAFKRSQDTNRQTRVQTNESVQNLDADIEGKIAGNAEDLLNNELLVSESGKGINNTQQGAQSNQSQNTDIDIPEDTSHVLDYIITSRDLSSNMNVLTGNIFAKNEEHALAQLIDVYANMLAQEFALNTSETSAPVRVQVQVDGIASLTDYVDLIALLRSIPAVFEVNLVAQNGKVATVELEQNIDVQRLRAILSLDSRLRANNQANIMKEDSEHNDTIAFFWNG